MQYDADSRLGAVNGLEDFKKHIYIRTFNWDNIKPPFSCTSADSVIDFETTFTDEDAEAFYTGRIRFFKGDEEKYLILCNIEIISFFNNSKNSIIRQ